ncbi:MAG: KH domain-containing protein [Candidatus Micrarchaeaceae archaeon]
MEVISIPKKRTKVFTNEVIERLEKRLNCKIEIIDGNRVNINGDGYSEYNAGNVISAIGRGFDVNTAEKLLINDYYFKYIRLRETLNNRKQIERIKSRIIGKEGKSIRYIRAVSGADIVVYGDTIGMIGKIEEIEIASAAIKVLIEGGTHKRAFRVMESVKRNVV